MILLLALGAIASKWLLRIPATSGQAPRSSARYTEADRAWALMCVNISVLIVVAIGDSHGTPKRCKALWNPIAPSPSERSCVAL